MVVLQPRTSHVAGWVGLVALSFTAAAVSAAAIPPRGITPPPTAAFLPRRRHNKAFQKKHFLSPPMSSAAKAREFRHIIPGGRLVKELFAIRGGGSTGVSEDASAGSQGESESESKGYQQADDYDTTATFSSTDDDDDDAYGETYDQEEAEIIEGYYSNQIEGGDTSSPAISTTDAADAGNVIGDANADGISSTASMEESAAKSTTDSDEDVAGSSPAESAPTASSIPPEILTKRTSASDLRVAGVAHHHDGDLASAADVFLKAAEELEAGIHIFEELLPEEEQEPSELAEMVEEAATCRLHEALCHLKQQKYALCIQSCTAVLEDGVQVVPLDEDDSNADGDANAMDGDENKAGGDDAGAATEKRAAVIRVTPTGGGSVATFTAKSSRPRISAAARARAYHRRAKARLALQDISGAIEDAKEAAYLGDRNAVSLYGRILREHSSTGGSAATGLGGGMGNASGGSLAEMLGGSNPFLSALSGSSGSADSSPSSSALLSSLLGSASGSENGSNADPFGGLGSLLGFGAGPMAGNSGGGKAKRQRRRKGRGSATGGGMDSLAKSLMKNLVKRIDDDKTQTQICNFCQGASADQVKMYAGMAGMQMADATASQIVAFANGVTKKKLRRVVKLARRGISAVKITSKVAKVIQKYKHLIVIVLICGWTKSSWLRDAPVNKKAIKQAAKEAGKVAAMVK